MNLTMIRMRGKRGSGLGEKSVMRKLILHMMTTMDGFIADSKGKLSGWTNWDEEMKAFYNGEVFARSDTIMYGRRIYEEMVPAWTAIAGGHANHHPGRDRKPG